MGGNGELKKLTFKAEDVWSLATMMKGDRVRFNISTNKETGAERAVNVTILASTFDETLEQRKTGMVIAVGEESGLIKAEQHPELFYKSGEMVEFKKLELGQKVEFT